VADEQAEVVIGSASLLTQLGAGRGCDVVGLGERHLLLLLWRCRDEVGADSLS
jgi:hypothetical protein